MMRELLIENWTTHVSYDQFFQKCAPLFCYYPIEEQFDCFVLIVSMIGLRLALPILVSVILWIWRRIRNRTEVSPISQQRPAGEFPTANGESHPIFSNGRCEPIFKANRVRFFVHGFDIFCVRNMFLLQLHQCLDGFEFNNMHWPIISLKRLIARLLLARKN